jgi:SnoaL-like domain
MPDSDNGSSACQRIRSVETANDERHNADVVECYLSGELNGQPERLDELFSQDVVIHRPLGADIGLPQVKAALGGNVLSEARTTFSTILTDGEFVAVRLHHFARFAPGARVPVPGRPGGPNQFHCPDPTKPVEWDAQAMFRFGSDGKIAEEWVSRDEYGFLEAIGVTITEFVSAEPND